MYTKHETTPRATELRDLIGGAMTFRLPKLEHLFVAELSQLPCAESFPHSVRGYHFTFEGAQWYGNHSCHEERQLFICLTGRVVFNLHDGKRLLEVELFPGEALFIPARIWHAVRTLLNGSTMWVHSDQPYKRNSAGFRDNLEGFIETHRTNPA